MVNYLIFQRKRKNFQNWSLIDIRGVRSRIVNPKFKSFLVNLIVFNWNAIEFKRLMGVTGLWKLIEASGKPIPLETLENKVLAIGKYFFVYIFHKFVK